MAAGEEGVLRGREEGEEARRGGAGGGGRGQGRGRGRQDLLLISDCGDSGAATGFSGFLAPDRWGR